MTHCERSLVFFSIYSCNAVFRYRVGCENYNQTNRFANKPPKIKGDQLNVLYIFRSRTFTWLINVKAALRANQKYVTPCDKLPGVWKRRLHFDRRMLDVLHRFAFPSRFQFNEISFHPSYESDVDGHFAIWKISYCVYSFSVGKHWCAQIDAIHICMLSSSCNLTTCIFTCAIPSMFTIENYHQKPVLKYDHVYIDQSYYKKTLFFTFWLSLFNKCTCVYKENITFIMYYVHYSLEHLGWDLNLVYL